MEQTTPSTFRELKTLALIFAVIVLLFKLVFYNENILTVTKTIAAIYWLFIIPGYCLTLVWKEQISLTERFVITTPISAAILGITSYYLGLAGLDLIIQNWLLPATIIIITALIAIFRNKY